MKVSIIIPVYNVSDYVERCLNSVMAQTYTDLECIIVDDCTPDDSIAKCERMIAQYDGPIEFKILHHKHNRGLSAARNTGIDASIGESVYFLDSDDWIIPECIQLFCDCVKKHPKTEVVMGGAKATNGGYLYMDYEKKTFLPDYSDDVNWINKAFLTHEMLSMTAWNVLINRSFLIKNQLFFVEGLINEDEVWHFMLSKYVSHLSILHKNTYLYFIREKSIITSNNRILLERNFINILDIWVKNCGGIFKRREVSSIFYHVHIRYMQFDDKMLKKGLRSILCKTLQKTSFMQTLGILIYLIAPQSVLEKPPIINRIFCLVGRV